MDQEYKVKYENLQDRFDAVTKKKIELRLQKKHELEDTIRAIFMNPALDDLLYFGKRAAEIGILLPCQDKETGLCVFSEKNSDGEDVAYVGFLSKLNDPYPFALTVNSGYHQGICISGDNIYSNDGESLVIMFHRENMSSTFMNRHVEDYEKPIKWIHDHIDEFLSYFMDCCNEFLDFVNEGQNQTKDPEGATREL